MKLPQGDTPTMSKRSPDQHRAPITQNWSTIVQDWPHTPTPERLEAAIKAWNAISGIAKGIAGQEEQTILVPDHQGKQHPFNTAHTQTLNFLDDDPAALDLIAFNDCMQAMLLHKEAVKLFQAIDFHSYRGGYTTVPDDLSHMTPANWYAAALTQFLQSMAMQGDGDTTIGIAWQQWQENSTKAAVVMTKLSRHPDWMGFNPMLQGLQQVKFVFHPAEEEPCLPGHLLGFPAQDNHFPDLEQNPFPPGQATALRNILNWHGAAQCLWSNDTS